jgi:hypothetical protein
MSENTLVKTAGFKWRFRWHLLAFGAIPNRLVDTGFRGSARDILW